MAAPHYDLHVVFGTGPVGLAVMAALVAQGKRVRGCDRPGKDPPDLSGRCRGL